jgi:predicted methyltransferase
MYDQSKLSELIRFARVEAGFTVIDVYPGGGDWTRLFSDVVGPGGRVCSFMPAEVADFKNDPVGRMRALRRSRAERTSKPLDGPRGDAGGHATSGCRVAAPVLPRSPHCADRGQGATAADFNRAVYERLRP